jgi:hypothetical protein
MSPTTETRLTKLVKRFLDVIWVVMIAGAIIWPIVTLVVGLHIPDDPAERHTDVSIYSGFIIHSASTDPVAAATDEPGVLVMKGQGDVLYNNTRGLSAWYLSAAIPEIMGLIFLFGLFQLRRIFAQLEQGAWYAEENIPRIRMLGMVIVAFNLVLPLLQYFGGRAVLGDMQMGSADIVVYPAFQFSLLGLITGLAIIVLSGVMREAVTIRHEQSLTI